MILYNIYIIDKATRDPLVFVQSGVPHPLMTLNGNVNPLYQAMRRMDKDKHICLALMSWSKEDMEHRRLFWF